jgi:hypothetical protein
MATSTITKRIESPITAFLFLSRPSKSSRIAVSPS